MKSYSRSRKLCVWGCFYFEKMKIENRLVCVTWLNPNCDIDWIDISRFIQFAPSLCVLRGWCRIDAPRRWNSIEKRLTPQHSGTRAIVAHRPPRPFGTWRRCRSIDGTGRAPKSFNFWLFSFPPNFFFLLFLFEKLRHGNFQPRDVPLFLICGRRCNNT